MKNLNKEQIFRVTMVVIILFSGLLLLPIIDLPAEALGWELFAGVYTPELEVNPDSGRPGSVFAFIGSNYPADSQAIVYVNGVARGSLMTDSGGSAAFLIDTANSPTGLYNVTLEVDINASATQGFELTDTGDLVLPPPDFNGQTFSVSNVMLYLPNISKGQP